MELNLNYWRVTFNNGSEFLIETIIDNDSYFRSEIERNTYITLQKKDGKTPINLKSSEVFSFQIVDKLSLGNQSKLWSMS